MDVKKAKKILGEKYKNKTDQEIQAIIDKLKPLVGLAVQETKKEFGLTSYSESVYTRMEGGQ